MKKYLLILGIILFPFFVYALPIGWDGSFTNQTLVPLNSLMGSRVGIGTSTPGGLLSIHAPSNLRLATGSPLLLIASSTPTATTTLFNLSNTGSTTFWGFLNVGSNASTTGQMGTSTFNNGIRLLGGCFQVFSGACLGGGITTLNGLTTDPQTFSVSMPPLLNGRYSTLTITSSGTDHNFMLEASSSPTFGNLFATSTISIGTTTPGSGLSVHGTSTQVTGTTTTHSLVATSTLFVGSFGNLFNVLQTGRVGIGTTSPGSLLSVQSGDFQTTGTTTTHALVATSTLFIGAVNSSMVNSSFLYFGTSGFLGLGTTSPSALLSVHGSALISATTTTANLIATSSFQFPRGPNVQASSTSGVTAGLVLDTSDDQLVVNTGSSSPRVFSSKKSLDINISSSTSFKTDDDVLEKMFVKYLWDNIVIERVFCTTDAGTQVVSLYESNDDYTVTSLAVNGIDGATTITCDTEQLDDGSLSNAEIREGHVLRLHWGAAASSPKQLNLSVKYRIMQD